jgi:ribosomal-protein-alanine N-acetyltransferase
MPAPTLRTKRLLLRPFTRDDIAELVPLSGAREVAATTRIIPHPYTFAHAEKFIEECDKGEEIKLAIVSQADSRLIGGCVLRPDADDATAEIGYWIGVPYWGNGFATETAKALLQYSFEALQVNRVYAFHTANNPASGQVLQKIGLKHEGTMRQHQRKWGEFLDIEIYGMLREEWAATPRDPL